MSFLRFGARPRRGVARLLIDVGPSSVAGACAAYLPDSTPILCYNKRVPIIIHPDEPPETAMERALEMVCEALGTEGAAALGRLTGSGRIDEATISIDAPWQQTTMHMEEKREQEPFTFTRRTLAEILERSRSALTEDSDRTVEQHVVGIRLNGYETARPFGQMARRATLLILISWIHSGIIEAIHTLIRRKFPISHPTFIGGPTLRYRALSAAFPHERNMLILDAAGHTAVLSLVRARMLVAVQEFPCGEEEDAWVAAVNGALRQVAASYPLPHTILLVADGAEAPAHARALEEAKLGTLWLSDDPPKIIPVSRMSAAQVAMTAEALPDIRLALMVQYAALGAVGD